MPHYWCDVLEWNEHGVQAPHGQYIPVRNRGRDVCPKCLNSEEEAGRQLDPQNDGYRRRLVERGYSFHPAADDWHPCFHGGLVGIAIIPNTDASARVRITGADDTSMERYCTSYEEARHLVRELTAMPFVPMKGDLLVRGFIWG